ncbi:Pyrroline-5-carboxylate reductase [Prochlorococcus marinus str. MIT 1313]|nr:pyrroline-5-carboxylate reductase [Prochlorococcus marinus]KZR70551.1 Pyrroline-5-carboxylate reductase [Prochlorococcus marinus str. MIT 1313]KZR76316.1 Pyrroline-5-carboxylate reductase [Prochlorococcus marinus str. MIT 1318]
MPCSLGVIGLGRMAQALVLPLLKQGELSPQQVVAVVGRAASVERLADQLPIGLPLKAADDPTAAEAWMAPIQLLAVKPQQLDQIAASAARLKQTADRPQLLISVLAGVSLARLQQAFPAHACVRAVPNTPALVGAGLTGLSWGEGVTPEQRLSVERLFLPVSEVLELPESQLDAFLALTSSGPAYVALVAEAMADGAVAAGLPRSLAHHLAHRTLAGTAALLKEQKLHPAELKDMVTSPGGTTIAALRKLERAGVRSALIEAVVAAAQRSRELA